MSTSKGKRTLPQLILIVVGMFGFGYALVPLYSVFCDITGLNGSTSGVKKASKVSYGVDLSRTVKVQFLGNLNEQLNWEFAPEKFEVKVHPGEVTTARFRAKNLRSETVVGQAIPSVMPAVASLYFTKTECFCFSNQTFKAGEERVMPVTFVVNPDLPDDVTTLTLAYTFFDITATATNSINEHKATSNGG
ncbi:MAG: cytochrome c oxidase assembly protein [bacterium]